MMPELPIDLKDIVTESLKSATSPMIDAWLGPIMQRWKAAAERRDIEHRRMSNATAKVFDDYIRRLIRRVSTVTTILAPEKPFAITDIYEPVALNIIPSTFIQRSKASKEQKNDYDLQILSETNCLIVDSAGMGKSTFAKYLTIEILYSTPRMPLFFELRRLSDTDTLIIGIMRDIDQGAGVLDAKLFVSILKNGGLTIILDGFDELPDQRKKDIATEITDLDLYSKDNSIVITSRPNSFMPTLTHVTVFDFVRLNQQQAESIIRKIDTFLSLRTGELLIQKFNVVPQYFLEIPLLLVLLYKTFNYNQSIPYKIAVFYDEIYNAFYKGHDLTKVGYVREKVSGLDSIEFRKLLGALSLIMIVKEKNILENRKEAYELIDLATQRASIQPKSNESFFIDLLENVPFIIKDGSEFRFFHKSLTEFFAAEYLCSGYSNKDIISRIVKKESYNKFIDVCEFIAEIDDTIYDEYILGSIAKEALSIKIDNFNDVLLTLQIVSDVYIGFFEDNNMSDDNIKGKSIDDTDRKIIYRFVNNSPQKEHNFRIHTAKYNLERFRICIISNNYRMISKRILNRLFISRKFDENRSKHETFIGDMNKDMDFKIEEFIIMIGKEFENITSNTYIYNTLYSMLDTYFVGGLKCIYTIDIEKCQKILDDIEARKKSVSLLDELLGL